MNTETKVAMKVIRRRRRQEGKRRWSIFRTEFSPWAIQRRHEHALADIKRRIREQEEYKYRRQQIIQKNLPLHSKIINKVKNLWKPQKTNSSKTMFSV